MNRGSNAAYDHHQLRYNADDHHRLPHEAYGIRHDAYGRHQLPYHVYDHHRTISMTTSYSRVLYNKLDHRQIPYLRNFTTINSRTMNLTTINSRTLHMITIDSRKVFMAAINYRILFMTTIVPCLDHNQLPCAYSHHQFLQIIKLTAINSRRINLTA